MAAQAKAARAATPKKRRGLFGLLGRLMRLVVFVLAGYFVACTLLLVAYRWIPPPATGVQIQRFVEAQLADAPMVFRYDPVRSDEMSLVVRHAAVASEDARFYIHKGFDWEEVRRAREDAERRGTAPRGASTITQQLVKNLFLTAHRSWVRKGLEVPLTLLAELILSKERILTLYLNVAEFGPGIFGVEAATQYHYGVSAANLSRDRAARLIAVLPAPHDRRPQDMNQTAARIQTRMRQMGW